VAVAVGVFGSLGNRPFGRKVLRFIQKTSGCNRPSPSTSQPGICASPPARPGRYCWTTCTNLRGTTAPAASRRRRVNQKTTAPAQWDVGPPRYWQRLPCWPWNVMRKLPRCFRKPSLGKQFRRSSDTIWRNTGLSVRIDPTGAILGELRSAVELDAVLAIGHFEDVDLRLRGLRRGRMPPCCRSHQSR